MKNILNSIRGSKEIIVTLFTLLAVLLTVLIPEVRPYKEYLIPSSILLGLVLAGFVTIKDVVDKFLANKTIDLDEIVATILEIISETKTTEETTSGKEVDKDIVAKG